MEHLPDMPVTVALLNFQAVFRQYLTLSGLNVHTVAKLMLSSQIVPYSQILLNEHISICTNYIHNISQEKIMTDNPLIDESNISYIIHNFNEHWVQRLAAFSISLGLNSTELVKKCFSLCSRQFMQIKCTVNILCLCTHIT